MGSISLVWKGYSEALFRLAKDSDSIPLYKQQVEDLYEAVTNNCELKAALENPNIPKNIKKRILTRIFSYEPYIMNLLKLLIDKGRFAYIKEICTNFICMANEAMNIQIAYVTSAVPLSDSEVMDLKALFEKKTRLSTEINVTVDRSCIAGLKVRIKDMLIDNTAASRLEHMKRRLELMDIKAGEEFEA